MIWVISNVISYSQFNTIFPELVYNFIYIIIPYLEFLLKTPYLYFYYKSAP